MRKLSQASRIQFQTGYEGEATDGNPGGCGKFPSLMKLFFSFYRLDWTFVLLFSHSAFFSKTNSVIESSSYNLSIYLFLPILFLTKIDYLIELIM